MKATAQAPSNIAFTKYWGKKDEELRLPENGSISMCLSNLLTTTTVEFSKKYLKDEVRIDGKKDAHEASRAINQLERIRTLAKIDLHARVESVNSFPSSHGLSSSASGFAALTLASTKAAGLILSEKELSILARQGSGSACRSIPAGFVEWLDGNSSETSYAISIFPPNYWQIADVVAIVSAEKKEVSTTAGQKEVLTSPFLKVRLSKMKEKNDQVKEYIKKKDFTSLGQFSEAEALELHAIMITQSPPLIYLQPNTILLIKLIQKWRAEGLECYFTINTGQDVHILVEKKDLDQLTKMLSQLEEVKEIIINFPSEGARLTTKHLF